MRYLAHKLQIQALVNSHSKLIKRTMPKAIKKRHEKIGFNEVRGCAVSDANAETMLRAISNLQKALIEAGYGPR